MTHKQSDNRRLRHSLIHALLLIALLAILACENKYDDQALLNDDKGLVKITDSSLGTLGDEEPVAFRVRRIIVLRQGIGQRDDWFTRLMNRLHIGTREEVVLSDLDFSSDDVIDVDTLHESKRILLRSGLFQDVSIYYKTIDNVSQTKSHGNQEADVIIVTKDAFTFFSQINGGMTGGNEWAKFDLGEANLLGRGYYLATETYTDNFESRFIQTFRNPRLLGSHWVFTEKAGLYFDEQEKYAGYYYWSKINRPLLYRRDKWAFASEYGSSTLTQRTYSGGQISLYPLTDIRRLYQRQSHWGESMITRSWGLVNKINLSAGFGFLNWSNEHKDNLNDPEEEYFKLLEPDRDDRYGLMEIFIYRHEYIGLHNHNYISLAEYVRKGHSLSYRLTPGLNIDNQKYYRHTANAAYNIFLSSRQIVKPYLTYAVRLEGGHYYDEATSVGVSYYLNNFGPGLLFANAYAIQTNNIRYASYRQSQDRYRGYLYNEFAGDHEWEGKLEYRWHPVQLWYFASSFLLFAEAHALSYGHFGDPVRSIGTGVRAIIPEMRSGIFQISLAYPLDLDYASSSLDQRILSFSYGQRF